MDRQSWLDIGRTVCKDNPTRWPETSHEKDYDLGAPVGDTYRPTELESSSGNLF